MPPFLYAAYIVVYAAMGGAVSHMAAIFIFGLAFLALMLGPSLGLAGWYIGRDVVKHGRW